MNPRSIPFVAGLLIAAAAHPATKSVGPATRPPTLTSPVQDKNFYLLSMIERTGPVREAAAANKRLALLADAKRRALAHAVESCGSELDCYASAMKWSDSECGDAAQALKELYRQNDGLNRPWTDRCAPAACFSATADNPARTCWRRHGSIQRAGSTTSSMCTGPARPDAIQPSMPSPTISRRVRIAT